jgi:Icc-related predicted phosphoesterase
MLNKVSIPDADMIIHAGDALSRGTYSELLTFLNRYEKLPHYYKIYVPGNHDMITEQNEDLVKRECAKRNIVYLNNNSVKIEGIEIWGSAITPRFHNWAWNRDSDLAGTSYSPDNPNFQDIKPYWDAIPDTADIIITHGPPMGIKDISIYNGDSCGCRYLLNRVLDVKPKFHIFGHIHKWHGTTKKAGITFVNASTCTEQYKPTNEPIIIEVDND